MDQQKLILIVKQYPISWDRTHPYFRDKEKKELAWNEIGAKMNWPGSTCREIFKSVREKYIRERDRMSTKEWPLVSELQFLDSNIIPRNKSRNSEESQQTTEKIYSNIDNFTFDGNPAQFDRMLVSLVKEATPIWDRNLNTYANKQLKANLWATIASKLKRDVSVCTLRWKGLREKYIRQKIKQKETGYVQWELLNEMSFLEKVILYRRKAHEIENSLNSFSVKQNFINSDNSNQDETTFENSNNSFNDSSNDLIQRNEETSVLQQADSSLQSSFRKRAGSTNSYEEYEKSGKAAKINNNKQYIFNRSPEQVFGDLVSMMLSKKSERNKTLAMIEIMAALSRFENET